MNPESGWHSFNRILNAISGIVFLYSLRLEAPILSSLVLFAAEGALLVMISLAKEMRLSKWTNVFGGVYFAIMLADVEFGNKARSLLQGMSVLLFSASYIWLLYRPSLKRLFELLLVRQDVASNHPQVANKPT